MKEKRLRWATPSTIRRRSIATTPTATSPLRPPSEPAWPTLLPLIIIPCSLTTLPTTPHLFITVSIAGGKLRYVRFCIYSIYVSSYLLRKTRYKGIERFEGKQLWKLNKKGKKLTQHCCRTTSKGFSARRRVRAATNGSIRNAAVWRSKRSLWFKANRSPIGFVRPVTRAKLLNMSAETLDYCIYPFRCRLSIFLCSTNSFTPFRDRSVSHDTRKIFVDLWK